jgi:glycosyltransferase involved in cell wall biosynthesis
MKWAKMNPRISVILNVYRRSANFGEQLLAIKNQSVKPVEILVWENGTECVPDEFREGLSITRGAKNYGVWARFAYALNATGDYVCVFDDDTIPGSQWLENCYETILKTPGLIGTRGIIFDNQNAYSMHSDVGVYGPSSETKQVDIVGHSWFFKKDWLGDFWGELGNRFPSDIAGEDIHFSYVLQQRLNLPTLVPPHPWHDLSLWGSNPDRAKKLGGGRESISQSAESLKRFENALQHYRKLGFKTLAELQPLKSKHPNFIYFLIQKFPRFSHQLARRMKILFDK